VILQREIFSFVNFIESTSKDRYYIHKLSFFTVILTWLFAAPKVFYFYLQPDLSPAWETIMLKSQDLTNNLEHIDPNSWQAKKVFRLTIPLIIKLLHISPHIIIFFQIIIGFLIYFFSYKLAFRISKDSVQATLLTLGLGFLYFGKASFFEFSSTWFDGFSYFFLLMAMFNRNVFVIFLFSTLAAWNDERAFIGLSIVLLFHQFQYFENRIPRNVTIRNVLYIDKGAISVAIAVLLYIVVRLILTNQFHMHTPTDGANLSVLFNRTYYFIPIGLLTFFEGFWVLLFLFFFLLLKSKDYLRFSLVSTPLLVLTVVSFSVTDITRSGSFSVPIIFVILVYLQNRLIEADIRKILLLCLLVSAFIPPVVICPDWEVKYMFPKPSFIYILEYLIDFIKTITYE